MKILRLPPSLDGKVEDADTEVAISIDASSSATRDEDYVALFVENNKIVEPIITIPAGEVSGSVVLRLNVIDDKKDEGTETISLTGSADGLASDSANINLTNYKAPDKTPPPAFAEGTMIDDISAIAGTAIADVELPAATGGSGTISYSTSDLPAGVSFDDSTRTVSGTPEAEGTTEVTYTATDGAETKATLTFSIMVGPMLAFGDTIDDIATTLGKSISAELPAATGGDGAISYSTSDLPAGVSFTFNDSTRTVSGTPEAEGTTEVTYTATDGAETEVTLTFSITVNPMLDFGNLGALFGASEEGAEDRC